VHFKGASGIFFVLVLRFFPTFFLLFCAASAGTGRPVEETELASRLKFYESIQRLVAKFHETKTIKNMSLKLESDGELTIDRSKARPNLVIWKVTRPSPLTVSLTQGKLDIVGADGKAESYSMEGAARDSLQALVAWLRLDPEELAKTYLVTDLGGERFRFAPRKGSELPIQSIQMKLEAGSYLEELEIMESSGDRLVIRFEKPRIERIAHAK
jgi:hypothetical protein